jgi:WD40 repeat protein
VAVDGTARLWDLADPRDPAPTATFAGHTDLAAALAFAPGGGRLATGSLDRSVRFWQTSPSEAAARICDLSMPVLTRQEWDEYLGGAPYRTLC